MFRRYDHLERLGHDEVSDILFGDVWIYPKLDGTNSSVWLQNNQVKAGSRNRVLSLEEDNAGFNLWVEQNKETFLKLFSEFPNWILYSEWLVPHTLKTYREEAWRKSYIFDVFDRISNRYVAYSAYSNILENYNLDIIPPLCKITNPSSSQVADWLERNNFLIQDNVGAGEGITIKNYEYKNKFGRQVWAKLVRSEFKDQNRKVFGHPEIEGEKQVEAEIIAEFCTEALVLKTRAKIQLECPDKRSLIPRLLQTVYYELIREELWGAVRKFKNPIINFKKLQKLCEIRTKSFCKDLF